MTDPETPANQDMIDGYLDGRAAGGYDYDAVRAAANKAMKDDQLP